MEMIQERPSKISLILDLKDGTALLNKTIDQKVIVPEIKTAAECKESLKLQQLFPVTVNSFTLPTTLLIFPMGGN